MKISEKALATLKQQLPDTFEPERHRLKIAATNYGIEEAKRIKDWPTLEDAVQAKIEEQQKFVAWWDATVWPGKGTRTDLNRERGFSLSEAEEFTGMKQQRVSDLGKRLQDIEKYRDQLLGAEYRAAMLTAIENVRVGLCNLLGAGEAIRSNTVAEFVIGSPARRENNVRLLEEIRKAME